MNPTASNPDNSQKLSPVIGWLAAGALLFLGAAIAWSAVTSRQQTAALDQLESDWQVRYPEYIRLSRVEERLARMRSAAAELDGSWRDETRIGRLLADCVQHFPDSIVLGKISLDSAYRVDTPATTAGKRTSDPQHTMDVVVAARCFSERADEDILALVQSLQHAPELADTVQSVSLEGVMDNPALDNGIAANTVFALRLPLAPRVLLRTTD